ncbi:MAG: hypothetical protein FWC06_00370 [Treponema sp.]|nr:hypothetical protein [Treponema sp.]
MKKCLFMALIVVCFLLIAGCATRAREPASVPETVRTPTVEPAPAPVREPSPVTTPAAAPAIEPVQTVVREPSPVTPAPTPVPVRQEIVLTGASYHMTVNGDMLHLIAATAYGDENMYYFPLIRLANPAIVNPDIIEIGVNLVIPDLQANLNNEGARTLLKADMLSIATYYEGLNRPIAVARLRELANQL